MASAKKSIQHVESLRGGAKILPLRRLFNAILTGGNDSLKHILTNYTMTIPRGSKYDQVQIPSHRSRFFSQHAQYWLSMRPGGVIKKFVTNKPLRMLKLHYKSVSYDDYDQDDHDMANDMKELVKETDGSVKVTKCLNDVIDYLVSGEKDDVEKCGSSNPDLILSKFICQMLHLDGWIRLHNVVSLRDDFTQLGDHTIDEIMVCDLSNMTEIA